MIGLVFNEASVKSAAFLIASVTATLCLGAGVLAYWRKRPAMRFFVIGWIGVFVASVGLAYLYPLLPRWRRAGRLRTVLEVTALQRAAVALLVGCALAGGALPPGWWVVAVTDATLAAAQLVLLRSGGWE